MLSEKYAKVIRSLVHKKYRQEYNLFVAEGKKAVLDILAGGFKAVDRIFITPDIPDYNEVLLQEWADKIHPISHKEMTRISNMESAPDILLTGQIPPPFPVWDAGFQPGIHLYLDQIQDPGNLGTILRTAEWFGVQTVGLSEGCADLVHPKVIQSSMGSFCRIKYWTGALKNPGIDKIPLVGADLDGVDVFKYSLPVNGILVIGNEGQGISPQVRTLLSHTIKIPPYSGTVESLNAAIATAILLSEWQRQLNYK